MVSTRDRSCVSFCSLAAPALPAALRPEKFGCAESLMLLFSTPCFICGHRNFPKDGLLPGMVKSFFIKKDSRSWEWGSRAVRRQEGVVWEAVTEVSGAGCHQNQ